MFGVVGVQCYFLGSFDWDGSLEHLVVKPLVVAAMLLGFSDKLSAAKEKGRPGDDEWSMLDTEESIYCTLNNPHRVLILTTFPIPSIVQSY
ncbi:hypothetical protein TNCV_3375071 [Trichonephila clavipes]|nr:hypothetical protein TNCV_3375071 [Trichonephila clavipes]